MALEFKKQVSNFFGSRTSGKSPSLPTLPFDIWQEIVKELSLPTLLSLCLVDKNLYMLTQPLVFKHLVIRPNGQLKTLARNFRRLLRSPRIAGAVHHFHVDLSAFPHTKTVQSASDIVLGEFAESASAFQNLRHFTFVSVYINLSVLIKLQKLAAPFTLSLKSCIFASELTTTNMDIPISNLQFADSSPFIEYATPRRRYPELFLRTEHLQSIIAGREYAETALIEMADYTRPFTRLTHLELPIESASSNYLIPVLSLCPNLEILNLNGRITLPHITDYNIPFASTFLPKLKSFNGPLLFARRLFLSNHLLPSHNKRKLDFITLYLSHHFSLHADTKMNLGGSCTEGEIISDTIRLLPDTTSTLNFPALCEFGPEGLLPQIKRVTTGGTLKHLGINSDPRYYHTRCFQPDQFIHHLLNSYHHFPNTLEILTIGIQIKDPFKCKRLGGKKESKIKQEAEILSQTSFEMIPSLKMLKVWHWAKPAPRWVTWVKQVNGRIDTFWQDP